MWKYAQCIDFAPDVHAADGPVQTYLALVAALAVLGDTQVTDSSAP